MAEMAFRPPHTVEDKKAALAPNDRPGFFWKEMTQPEHHAEAQVLGNDEIAGGPVHENCHVGDFAGKLLLIKHLIGDVTVECVECAKTTARIWAAQVFLHLPDDAMSGHQKSGVNLLDEFNTLSRYEGT